MADYEVSGAYVDALLRSLRRTQKLEAVIEALAPAARPTIEDAWSDAWHPAMHLEALGEAVVKIAGAPAFEELAYQAMKDRFAPIVLPMLKRSLETTQRSPAAILSKLNGVVQVAIRGLEIRWKDESATSGLLQIEYPRPVAAQIDLSWRGVFRYIFEVTQPSGRVEQFYQSPEGDLIQYLIAW